MQATATDMMAVAVWGRKRMGILARAIGKTMVSAELPPGLQVPRHRIVASVPVETKLAAERRFGFPIPCAMQSRGHPTNFGQEPCCNSTGLARTSRDRSNPARSPARLGGHGTHARVSPPPLFRSLQHLPINPSPPRRFRRTPGPMDGSSCFPNCKHYGKRRGHGRRRIRSSLEVMALKFLLQQSTLDRHLFLDQAPM